MDYTKHNNSKPINAFNPLLQKSHFQFGTDPNGHLSSYQRDMIPYKAANYVRENQVKINFLQN
jgi:hypothetical protein